MHEALILEVLRKYSDENHRLSQGDIIERLRSEYGVAMERKAVKRNLSNLQEAGVDLACDETERKTPDGETQTLCTGWRLNRAFSDAELRLLIDSVLSSRHIAPAQSRGLIDKLAAQSSVYFRTHVKHIQAPPVQNDLGKQLFYTIEVLDEAISQGKKVRFCYAALDIRRQVYLRADERGQPKQYNVNPYQMAVSHGRYYLISNMEPHDNVVHFRLDRIREIAVLDEPVKPMRRVRGLEHGLHLPQHMAEHIYMFSGESVPVKFLAQRSILDDIFDWFGPEVRVTEQNGALLVRARANENAMFCWALQYGPHMEVLAPAALRERISKAAGEMAEKYKGEANGMIVKSCP